MANRLELADPDTIALCVITDFPLFDWNEKEDRCDNANPCSRMHQNTSLLPVSPPRQRIAVLEAAAAVVISGAVAVAIIAGLVAVAIIAVAQIIDGFPAS